MNRKRKTKWIVAVLFCVAATTLFADGDQLDVESTDEFSMEPLRDPFWPVGYFPDGWQTGQPDEDSQAVTSSSDWDAPAALIDVSGTSQMGDRIVAIINGQIVGPGEEVRVTYNGRIYRWKLKEVKPSGKVSLERVGIETAGMGFQPGEK